MWLNSPGIQLYNIALANIMPSRRTIGSGKYVGCCPALNEGVAPAAQPHASAAPTCLVTTESESTLASTSQL